MTKKPRTESQVISELQAGNKAGENAFTELNKGWEPLVQRVREEDDRDACEELTHRIAPLLIEFCVRMVPAEVSAEVVVGKALELAWNKRGEAKYVGQAIEWFCGTAVEVATDSAGGVDSYRDEDVWSDENLMIGAKYLSKYDYGNILDEIYRRHESTMKSYCRRNVATRDVEDAAMEAWFKLLILRRRFRDEGKLKAYLWHMARKVTPPMVRDEVSVVLGKLPDDFKGWPAELLRQGPQDMGKPLRWEENSGRVIWRGRMTVSERNLLLSLSEDERYQEKIEELARKANQGRIGNSGDFGGNF